HLVLPFSATYYDLEHPSSSSSTPTQSPWVGSINLEQHFHDSYALLLPPLGPPPPFPGYRIAPVGQLQLLIKTPTQAIKVFLLPYDLRNLPIGARMLVRERTYVRNPANDNEALRFALQIQFVCVESARSSTSHRGSRKASTTRRPKGVASKPDSARTPSQASSLSSKSFYVSKHIKVVFASCAPEKHETVRVERTDEVVLPSEDTMQSPDPSWERIVQKWHARNYVETAAAIAENNDRGRGGGEFKTPTTILSPLPAIFSPSSSHSRSSSPLETAHSRSRTPKTPSRRKAVASVDERELSERLLGLDL
ncbi:hypothetical protein P7C73_g5953, partial [Tremellales sp. Uapishka_1]